MLWDEIFLVIVFSVQYKIAFFSCILAPVYLNIALEREKPCREKKIKYSVQMIDAIKCFPIVLITQKHFNGVLQWVMFKICLQWFPI